jgi:capsular exopolysaccharide synthesis family protein
MEGSEAIMYPDNTQPEISPAIVEIKPKVAIEPLRSGIRTIDDAAIAPQVILARQGPGDLSDDTLFAVEKYRLLCTRVLQVARSLKSKVFLVTSAIVKDGKTLTALNLAYGLGRVPGKRTLLVELDLRRPSMKRVLGLYGVKKEMSFLESDDDWHQSLWELRPNLHALLAMTSSLRSDILLQSERMQTFLNQARDEYDYIVIDSAPLLAAADTHALLPLVDQALFVIRANQTPIHLARQALEILGKKTLGCVLNDAKELQHQEYFDREYLNTGESW